MKDQIARRMGADGVTSPGARLLVLNTGIFALAVALLVGPQLVGVPTASVSQDALVPSRPNVNVEAGAGCDADVLRNAADADAIEREGAGQPFGEGTAQGYCCIGGLSIP